VGQPVSASLAGRCRVRWLAGVPRYPPHHRRSSNCRILGDEILSDEILGDEILGDVVKEHV
jgi:hypothetical protein